ncbi:MULTISPECIES: MATE family efflux transporter [unclassified Mycoplasma]|uniref:MATE family efflux transporter n=1 Tax=unclassified Mycoplasma TaxID=2683645 RepID=UPI000FDDE23B
MKLSSWLPKRRFAHHVLRLIIPIALGQMLVTSVSFVDQFMVGWIEDVEQPLTTVLITTEIFHVAMSINLGIGLVGDIFGAQFFGAKMFRKFKAANKIKTLTNFWAALITVVFLNIFAERLLGLFIDHPYTLRVAARYLRLLTIGHVMYAVTMSFIGALNTIGKPRYQLYSSLVPLTVNIFFNVVFLYWMKLDLSGAALSTILARFLELMLVFIFVWKNRKFVWFGWNWWRFDFQLVKSMARRGLIITSQVALALGLVAKTAVWTNNYPDISEAVGIGYAINGLLWATFPGFSTASKVLIGRRMANNQFDQAYDESRKMLLIVFVFGLILGLTTLPLAFFLPRAVGLSSANEISAAQTMIIVEAFLIVFIICGVYIFSLLEAGGFSFASTFLNSYYVIAVVFPFASLLAHFTNISFERLYLLTQLLHSLGVFSVSLPFFFRRRWLRNITISHR